MDKKWPVFFRGFSTAWKGMRLTFVHMLRSGKRQKNQDIRTENYFANRDGQSTVLYPYEEIPVPDIGRYMLHNEIEDCIVCDKCAKICPVDCIDIEPIRSVEEFGKTSDGTSKRIYAARFDIDMAKCCFCGLCTTVCPTECLVMTPEYDVPVIDLTKLNFGFGNMSEAEADAKRKEWELEKSRKAAAAASATSDSKPAPSRPMRASPSMPAASKVMPEIDAQPSSPAEPENRISPIKPQPDSDDAE